MKKMILNLVLVCALVITLTGCGAKNEKIEAAKVVEKESEVKLVEEDEELWFEIKKSEDKVITLDPVIEEEVRSYLDKPEGDIMWSDALKIEDLFLIDDVDTLKGLEDFKNLKWVYLDNVKDNDFSPLYELPFLEMLSIYSDTALDMADLSQIVYLEDLGVSYSDIINYESVANFKNLKRIDIVDTGISSIEPLLQLELEYIEIEPESIKDIELLSEMKSLKGVGFDIEDEDVGEYVDLITDLPNITEVNINGEGVTGLDRLSDLKKLKTLDIYSDTISDLSFLEKLSKLENLELEGEEITDVTSVGELKKLTELGITGTRVKDISVLGKLTNLEELVLYRNRIKDITVLSKMKKIDYLDLSHNKIEDISALKSLKKLKGLDLSNNPITDVTPIKSLKELENLDISSTEVTDDSSLKKIIKNLDGYYYDN